MRTVAIRELKNRLSEYLRYVRAGESVLVTDRGNVVAQLSTPGGASEGDANAAGLRELARHGWVTLGAPNESEAYPALPPALRKGRGAVLLDAERGTR